MYFLRPLTYLPYLGCLYMRSTITVTLFIILLDHTTPRSGLIHVFPCPIANARGQAQVRSPRFTQLTAQLVCTTHPRWRSDDASPSKVARPCST